jgi:hypothetical protein
MAAGFMKGRQSVSHDRDAEKLLNCHCEKRLLRQSNLEFIDFAKDTIGTYPRR